MARKTDDDGSLKRLGGGRWQTRDERFTIEPESGTWVVLDAEQADDLGLPLVRGPFRSLVAAKGAIEGARGAEPALSPLAAKVAQHRERPQATSAPMSPVKPKPKPAPKPVVPEPPPEPKWIQELEPAERKHAHELIERYGKAGAPDPEGLARSEVAGKVPAAAAFAINRAIAALGPGATPSQVGRLLAAGTAEDLGASWRLVDGDGRPITLDEDNYSKN